jgi:hypothetical protein
VEPHPEDDQEDQDGACDEEYLHGPVLHGLATHSIHFAIPPASSMTFLASAYASWHRAQAAKDAGGSNTLVGRHLHAGDGVGQEQIDVPH